MSAFVISPLPSMVPKEVQTAGTLCSTENYSPSSLLRTPPPPSLLRSISRVRGYTAYLVPPLSRREEDGFSSCLARPCHRAGAITPPKSKAVSARLPSPMLPPPLICGFDLRGYHFRGRRCVRSRCGPVTRCHPYDDIVDRLQVIGFPPSCHLGYEAPGFCLGGLFPLKRVSLHWAHNLA
jgi:hypothetical protein